ncbi:AGAP010360-PA, partial [Anopheles gambiae str. PEST]
CADCRTVKICSYDQTVLTSYKCQDVEPDKPYCVGSGICSSDYDSESACVGLLCTGLGVFPDPQDCMKFHYCTSVGSYARLFKCPSGYVYNSKKKTCSRNTRCQTVRCRPNGRSIFIPFPQDPTYYAYCNYNRRRNRPVLRNVVVYKCTEGSEFNSLSNSCVFKCSREGFLPKPGDPTKFYWCRRVSGNLFGYEQVCPGLGSLFSAKLGICLPPLVTTTTEMSQM